MKYCFPMSVTRSAFAFWPVGSRDAPSNLRHLGRADAIFFFGFTITMHARWKKSTDWKSQQTTLFVGFLSLKGGESIRYLRESYQMDFTEVMFAKARSRFGIVNHENYTLWFLSALHGLEYCSKSKSSAVPLGCFFLFSYTFFWLMVLSSLDCFLTY